MGSSPPAQPRCNLIRAIGRWSLVALVVNSIIGSGVFGLPSTVAALIGNYSPYAVLAAGAGMTVIMGCFAEVASRFQEAGGPYLYARVAFGRLMGIQTAWMLWLGQVSAPAANANLFVIYLGEFFPHAKDPLPRAMILTVLVGLLTIINIRGVRAGTQVSNLFTAAKLVPLFAVIVLGLLVLQHHSWNIATAPIAAPGTSRVAESHAAASLRLRWIRDRAGAHERSEKSAPRRALCALRRFADLHCDVRADPVGGHRSPARRRA